MIDKKSYMTFEPLDYHSLLIKVGEGFYECLRKINKEKFNHWASQNIVRVGEVVNSYVEVRPNPSIIVMSENSGYEHIDAQCHYSAKAICILLPEFEYYTGFVIRNESIRLIIAHSFNVYNNRIVDFTKHITDPFNKLDLKSYPHEYFGINIPREFVMTFKDETLEELSMNPLICEWYCSSV